MASYLTASRALIEHRIYHDMPYVDKEVEFGGGGGLSTIPLDLLLESDKTREE